MSQYRNGLSMTVTAQTHYSATTARTIKTALLYSQPYSLLNGTSNGDSLCSSNIRDVCYVSACISRRAAASSCTVCFPQL